jgi:hypothetical protein
LENSSISEVLTELQNLRKASNGAKELTANQATTLRRCAARLCTIGTIEASEVFLKDLDMQHVTTPVVAKYGLTLIANCTSSEEARSSLVAMGAGTVL